jgi:hypothetical protein
MMKDVFDGKCPNCGAPLTGDHCEYCGITIYDYACINANEPCFIKFRKNNKVIICKAAVNSFDVIISTNQAKVYADNNPLITLPESEMNITVNFQVLPEDGILYKVADLDQVGIKHKIH